MPRGLSEPGQKDNGPGIDLTVPRVVVWYHGGCVVGGRWWWYRDGLVGRYRSRLVVGTMVRDGGGTAGGTMVVPRWVGG